MVASPFLRQDTVASWVPEFAFTASSSSRVGRRHVRGTVHTTARQPSSWYRLSCIAAVAASFPHQGAGFTVVANHIFEDEVQTSTSRRSSPLCAKHHDSPERVRAALFDRAPHSWRASARRPEYTSWLPGTALAQETILRHQFRSPEGCKRARFLAIRHGRSAGIGCWMHLVAKAMALAMRLQRVLVLLNTTQDPNMVWYQSSLCPKAHSWDCWFEPITNCTPHGDIFKVSPTDVLHDEYGHITEYTSADAPYFFHRFLRQCSGIKRNLWFYWWHAQWVAFFVRFNSRTRHMLDYLRRQKLKVLKPGEFKRGDRVFFWNPATRAMDQEAEFRRVLDKQMGDIPPGSVKLAPFDGSTHRWIRTPDVPFTIMKQSLETVEALPPGSVALHVRHGDKIIEMELLPFQRYLEQAERLADGDQTIPVLDPEIASSNQAFVFPKGAFSDRMMFISTEDPHVVFEALQLARSSEKPWNIAFTQENRTNDILMDSLIRKSAGKVTLESFLNLELALEADAWVCTLQSNWCQLIDELRMTIGGKVSSPYINIRSRLNAAFPEVRNSYVYW